MSNTERPVVLITGAGGLLGWSLKREFALSSEIIAPSRSEMDILKKPQTIDYIAGAGPGIVIHAAAYTAVDRAESEPELVLAVNSRGTGAVAEGAARCGALMVYISTDYVFSGRKGSPYTEDDEADPLSAYGRSKLAGENAVREASDNHLIVRTAWIFGPGGPNFVLKMAARAREGARVRVVDDQVGSPSYTPHVAAAIRKLCFADYRGIVNVANSGSCSWYELTREIYRQMGERADLVESMDTSGLDRPASRPAYSVLDCSRYRKLTGNDMPSWEDAVYSYLEAIKSKSESQAD